VAGSRTIHLAYPASIDGVVRGSASAGGPAPGIAIEASFWGVLHTGGAFDLSGDATIVGAVDAGGPVTESTPGGPKVQILWDPEVAGAWPPEGWNLPRTFVRSWRTEP